MTNTNSKIVSKNLLLGLLAQTIYTFTTLQKEYEFNEEFLEPLFLIYQLAQEIE